LRSGAPEPGTTINSKGAEKVEKASEKFGPGSGAACAPETSPKTDKVEAATILPMMLKASAKNLNFLVTWLIKGIL
jgi:hypothetical protein